MNPYVQCCRCDGRGFTRSKGMYGRERGAQSCARCSGTGAEPAELKARPAPRLHQYECRDEDCAGCAVKETT